MEQAELAELIRNDWTALRNIARKRANGRHDPDDLFQASLERALKSATRFDGTSLRGWFASIVHNIRKDADRHAARQAAAFDRHGALNMTWGRESLVRDDESSNSHVIAALDALPDHHREVIQAVILDGLPHAIVAERLGIPPGTLASRLARAKRTLRSHVAA